MSKPRPFSLRASHSDETPAIEGQCLHVWKNGRRCHCAICSHHGTLCYQHARSLKMRKWSGKWAPYGRCGRCKAPRGKPCVTHKGHPTFCHVGRMIVPSKVLAITEHGPVRVQLVELGGEPDAEGMVQAVFRLKPTEAQKFGPLMFEWAELKATVAKLEPMPLDRGKG